MLRYPRLVVIKSAMNLATDIPNVGFSNLILSVLFGGSELLQRLSNRFNTLYFERAVS